MAFTVADPGSFVVPLSDIIEQLQGKLTSSEIDQLLDALVSNRRRRVAPGDLITAESINQLRDDLEELNARVAALAGGGASPGNPHAVTTLHDAWTAYGALLKNGTFQPGEATADAFRSAMTVAAHFQDAMFTALAGGTLAYFGGTDVLLAAFRRLYDRQHELVVLFSGTIAGISDPSAHRRYATLLNLILEQDNAEGQKSLKHALDGADLPGAISAQDRVNGMVQNQGGDVTTGNRTVAYRGAVGATETLVVGSTQPVLYRFLVGNHTNRDLDVQLQAEFLPPRQAWTAQATVVGVDGAARSHISLARFNPSNPTDPASSQEVRVAVMTPVGATDGQTGNLQLSAFVPDPVNRRGFASRELTVHAAPVPQTPGIVAYSARSPIVSADLAHSPELTPVTLTWEYNFAAGTGPSTRDFRFRIDVTAPANPDPQFFFQFDPVGVAIDTAASTPTRKLSRSFQLHDGDAGTVTVTVLPLTGSHGTSLTFRATLESATDGVQAQSPSLTISVQN